MNCLSRSNSDAKLDDRKTSVRYIWNNNNAEMYRNNICRDEVVLALNDIADQVHDTDSVNVINEITQQLQDVILTSAEHCRKSTVANKNKIVKPQRSKWYDTECEKQRQLYNRYRNIYSRCKCEAVKCQRDKEKVKYQRLCKRKCQLYSNEQTEIWCDTKRKDQKLYWQNLKVRKPTLEVMASLSSFESFYSELFSSQINSSKTYFKYNVHVEELDKEISIYEIDRAIQHLKSDKAPGSDNVLSELIKNGGPVLKHAILVLFNKLYNCGHYPEQWATGIIVPIYKKGDRSSPENYRAITLTNVMSKMFTYILNTRMSEWLQESELTSECQFAYKTGYSTTDAIFVLHGILSCTVANKSSDLCLAFIDFTKAFDKINRDILYSKLMDIGVSSKFLNIIVDMYCKMKCRVRTDDGITAPFNMNKGLMQGESISPTLFSAFINDIVEAMNKITSMGVVINNIKITVLKYDDDLVLLATSQEGLQSGLDLLKTYCEENKLTVNVSKSKVMRVSKRRKAQSVQLYYDSEPLECVDSFKYLGIDFNNLNNTGRAVEQLCRKAEKARTVIDLHRLRHKTLSFQHILQLFDTLLKPILTYGSEIWGTANYDVIEKFHLKFLKQVLGVKASTNTCMIYAETGRHPMSIAVQKSVIKYWLKVIQCEKKRLISIIYCKMKETMCSWVCHVKDILCKYGFAEVWENQEVDNESRFIKLFEQRCADTHAQSCHEQIQQSSRCRLYKELKENHDIEPYLRRNISYTLRITFTKMRLSSHKLLVERGRWVKPKINYCDRLCTLCHKHDIQDEYHALMICSRYESLRKKYLKPYYYKRPSVYKFIQLMNTVNKREQFRLMIFTKLLMKDFNSTL